MKKLAIWISKTGHALREKLGSGGDNAASPLITTNNPAASQTLLARLPKIAVIFLLVVASYAILGFYALPALVKSKLPDIIQQETGRKAEVAQVSFNPFKLLFNIQGFKILEKSGKPFVSFDDLTLRLNGLGSIRHLALLVDEIALGKPIIQLVKNKDGKFNFEDMVKPTQKQEKEPDDGILFPLTIVKLAIKDGKVTWNDQHFNKPVSEEINAINLNLANLSTEPNTKAQMDFGLAIKSGGKLSWKSNLGITPLQADGTIRFDQAQLTPLLALALSDTAPFQLQGQELINVDYQVNMDKSDLKIIVKKSHFELKDFQFTDQSADKNLVKTPSFAIDSDAVATLGKNVIEVAITKAKFSSHDLHFSNQAADPVTVNVTNFNHDTDLKLTQVKDVIKISVNKGIVAVKNFKFNGVNQGKVEAKIPEIFLETAYQFDKTATATEVTLDNGKFDFHDLLLTELGNNTALIKIPTFAVADANVDFKNREVNIASVSAKNAEFQTWINPDGTFNYQKLIATPQGKKVQTTRPNYATARTVDFKEDVKTTVTVAKTAAAPIKLEKDWQVKVNNLTLTDFGVTFTDKTHKKPVIMTAKPINIKIENLVNNPKARIPFQLDMGLNKTGTLKVKGGAVLAPFATQADIDIKNIALEKLQPYIDKLAKVDLIEGNFNLKGYVDVKQPPNKPIDVKFKGNTNIAELTTRDQLANKDLIKWRNLTLKNMNVDLLANRYSADTLLIEKPYAKVTIRKDKTINYSDLMITDKSAKPKSTKTLSSSQKSVHNSPNKTPIFKLAKVKIVDGSSDFADLSLLLPFAAQIKSLDGGADGISSEQKSTIKVALKGSAYDLAPVDIKGEISPYLGNYNVDLDFDGLPMPLVTPYMVQFAGYKIEKGKLTLGLKYQIEKNKLNASNKILIDQLELGEQVENPDAVSLPLDLAITLLKDSEGKIKLDVPLTGSLEDPKFSMGGIIWDALINVLTKIVTSPFSALASLAGSDEDLSAIAFAAGSHTLDGKEMGKLDGVAKALKEKTALNLEIKGAAFEDADWAALQDEALWDQLKKRKAAELSKEEGKKVRAEYVDLEGDDYNDVLAEAFIEKFPTMAEKSLLGTPKLINSDAGDFYQVAYQKMSEAIKPEPERLKNLANDRAQAIANYLVKKAGIANSRVYILDSAVNPKRETKEIVSALSLKTN
jgi:outer membrane protein OmpA-like peptidoglycan-associated protein